MKLTLEMLAAGTDERGNFSLWHYDYHGLNEQVRKVAEKSVNDWGWECWSDEKHVASYAIDVINQCIASGLLEVPGPPGRAAPTREELHDIIMTRHCGPDWRNSIKKEDDCGRT